MLSEGSFSTIPVNCTDARKSKVIDWDHEVELQVLSLMLLPTLVLLLSLLLLVLLLSTRLLPPNADPDATATDHAAGGD